MEPIVTAGIVANIVSSVGIVVCNKLVWNLFGFNFVVLFSFCHFLTTAIVTRILLHMKLFEYRPAPISSLLPVSIGTLGSVIFMNLNLAKNTIGFYQISKLACIPATLVMQYLLYRKQVSYLTKLSLFVILLGVGVSTVAEVSINAIGLFYALVAVLFTAQGQIFTNSSQQQTGLDSMQLLYHTSPQIALGMFACIFLFEDVGAIFQFEYTASLIFMILLTCALAVLVNISNYLVIGKTSPITYQVVGHSKTCLVLILGFIVFRQPLTWRSMMGISTAMAGVVWYGEIKRTEATKPMLPQYAPVPKE